ncbi:MAG TPA: tetratricopeptide repeat protein [Pirellulales bacterium]|nr:tetratricopeptide repeat protein [Pirellulales bacterium]
MDQQEPADSFACAAAAGPARRKLLDFAGAGLLIGAVLAIYAPALHAPFIFDDRVSIVENPSIRSAWPLVGTDERPGPLRPPRDVSTAGRPLVNLTLALNYQSGRLDPTGYHAFNVAIHILAALLLWRLVRRTLLLAYFSDRLAGVADPLAFVAALVWAVHPLQTEAVEYVTQRTELLVSLFYLGTLYASLRYWSATAPQAKTGWLAAAIAAAAAGMASKEVMVTAPVVVLLFERTFLRRSFGDALRQSAPLYAGLCATWGLLAALNFGGARSKSAGFHLGVPAHVWWLTQAHVLLLYLKLIVWPWPLVIHYEFPYLHSFAEAWPWIAPVSLLGLATIALLYRRTATGFAWAAALLVLSPTLVVPIITEIAAERRMYLPLASLIPWLLVGSYLTLSRLADRAAPAVSARNAGVVFRCTIAVTLAIAAAGAWLSFQRANIYNDPIALWQDAAIYQPENSRVQNNLGVVLVDAGQPAEAISHYRRALDLSPDYTEAQSNLGVALVHLQQFGEAQPQFERALEINPNYADAHINLAHLLAKSGRLDEAVPHYEAALRLKPSAELHSNLGHILGLLGRNQQARAEFEEAVRLKPDLAEAHLNLGASLAADDPQAAISHYQAALRANPDFVEAYSNLGALLYSLGRHDEAIEQLREALRLRPDYAEAHSNLGIALVSAGKTAEGVEQFEEAIKLKPDVTGYANLAMAYAQAGRSDEAILMADRAAAMAREQGQPAMARKIEDWLKGYRRSQ